MDGPAGFTIPLKRPAVDVRRLPDGGFIFRSPYRTNEAVPHIGAWLRQWANATPERPFLSETGPRGKRHSLSYRQTLTAVEALASHVAPSVMNGHGPRPIVILATNSIDNALLQLAAMEASIPQVPLNPELIGSETLGDLLAAIKPGLVYVESGTAGRRALDLAAAAGAGGLASAQPGANVRLIRDLIKKPRPGARPSNGPSPETIAKIYSFSETKAGFAGIVASQAALTMNQEALAALSPKPAGPPVTVIDETPWWQVGGCWALTTALRNGGTLHLGDAKSGAAEGTPTQIFLDGAGFEKLVAALEGDKSLRQRFGADLQMIVLISGPPSPSLRRRFDELCPLANGKRVAFIAGFVAPGSATLDMALYFDTETADNIGLPVPGALVKLAPVIGEGAGDSELELYVKPAGPAPQSWATGRAEPRPLDTEGFFATGELCRLIDPMRPFLGAQRLNRRVGAAV